MCHNMSTDMVCLATSGLLNIIIQYMPVYEECNPTKQSQQWEAMEQLAQDINQCDSPTTLPHRPQVLMHKHLSFFMLHVTSYRWNQG